MRLNVKFEAYGNTTIKLYDENGLHIGDDYGHRPCYEIEVDNIEQLINSIPDDWEYTGDSNGTVGADFFGEYTYEDVCDEETILHGVFKISCIDSINETFPNEIEFYVDDDSTNFGEEPPMKKLKVNFDVYTKDFKEAVAVLESVTIDEHTNINISSCFDEDYGGVYFNVCASVYHDDECIQVISSKPEIFIDDPYVAWGE